MTEQELKNLWQTDRQAPMIDFTEIQRISIDWEEKLHRKARVDMWSQIISIIFVFLIVLYHPKMISAAVLVAMFGIWYIRELREYYKMDTGEIGSDIKHLLQAKTSMMKKHFRRKRIAIYLVTPLALIAALYGYGMFDKSGMTFLHWLYSLTGVLVISEIAAAVLTELYLGIFYKPAFKELRSLLQQLD